jgi:hypothetical protein
MEIISIQDFLDFHSDRIEDEKCVLFLGPCFGITDTGEKVYEDIRRKLSDHYKNKEEAPNFDHRWDTQFDNLFILRNLKEGRMHEVFELRGRLSEFYQKLRPHPVYDQIARLPFKAVITCTPDLLLRNSLKNLQIDHDFFYFSPKGQVRAQPRSNVPILFNLFGNAEEKDSLLVTYKDFFQFVFSIMGENDEIPVPLKNIIKNADLFVLLGFDFEKWYIPLILWRLNQEKINKQQVSVLGENRNYTENDGQKLDTTLFVLEEKATAIEIINTLTEKLQAGNHLRQSSKILPQGISLQVRNLSEEGKLKEAIQVLNKMYQDRQLKNDDVVATAGRLADIERDRMLGIVKDEDFILERNKIRETLLDLAEDLDNIS